MGSFRLTALLQTFVHILGRTEAQNVKLEAYFGPKQAQLTPCLTRNLKWGGSEMYPNGSKILTFQGIIISLFYYIFYQWYTEFHCREMGEGGLYRNTATCIVSDDY